MRTMKPQFRAGARCSWGSALTGISVLVIGLAASGVALAGSVSATPGIIQGVLTLNAPFVPNSVTVYAEDWTDQYTAQASAAQNGASCLPGSPNWCYSIVVESALTNAYYLRPIAYISETSPIYVTDSVPFPPTPLVDITPSATVNYDIPPYAPGEISGVFSGNDMNGNPLAIYSTYISFWDLSPSPFIESCGGSLAFCPFNSVFQSNAGPYEVFLKPADSYDYLDRAVSFQEGVPLGTESTTIQFNGTLPLSPTPAGGTDVIQNYTLNQVATITGGLSAPGQSIYNFQVTVEGSTTTPGGAFYENFGPTNISPTPLTQPLTYTARIFDLTDFTQPVYIVPLLTLSTDGTVLLEYPPTTDTTLTTGQIQTVDYTGTSATISGRVTLTPPYPVSDIYPGIQAGTQDGGLAQSTFTPDALGGTYTLPAFGDTWYYWRFGWNFNLGKPGFTSNYFVGQFLYPPTVPAITVADGGSATANFNFNTALVKVFFTAPTTPAGTTFSNPALAVTTGNYNSSGTFAADYVETGQATGPGIDATVAEVDTVLRVHGVPFQITPSAWINTTSPATGPTTFSPIILNPNPGDVIIVGIPGTLSLTVTSPQNGQVFSACQIPVTGSATGTQDITITVNGQPVPTTSANNPNDPNQVLFSTVIPGNATNMQITVMASAPGNTPVSETLTVTANCPLTLTCPANSGLLGTAYSSALLATGGVPPYQFSLPSGMLPSGLLLNSTSGAVAGTPTTADVSSFTAEAMDSSGTTSNTTTQQCAIAIAPAPLIITASSGSFTYGGTVPTITPSYSGFVNGDTPAGLTTQPTCSTAATSGSPISGSPYPSSCSGAVDPNYTITYVPGTVTESPAALAITASSASMTFGGAVPTITASYTYGSAVNSATPPSGLTGVTCSTAATSSSPVGAYNSTCTGAVDANYTISYLSGTVTVGAAPLVITASSGTMTYGGTAPTVTASYSGFVNGNTSASLTTQPTCTSSANNNTAAGTDTGADTCSGATDPNYTITYGAGNVTVNPAPLTITASSGTMVAGSTPPSITASYNGFVDGQTASSLTTQPTCSTTATSGSLKGTYATSCSGAVDANYTITYVAGTMTVTASTSTGNPIASLSPTCMNFTGLIQSDCQKWGKQPGVAQVATLTNIGTGILNIASIQLAGAQASDFAETNTCPSALQAGASCTISITFNPTTVGPSSASLVITDNSNDITGSTQSVSLNGAGQTQLQGNFNEGYIRGVNYLWFSSSLSPQNINSKQTTSFFMTNGVVTFTQNNQNVAVAVPDCIVTFSPNVTSASTTWDSVNNRWVTVAPTRGYSGNTFLSAVGYQVPSGGFPGSITNVAWTGAFSTDTPGASLNWQWAAAPYSQLPTVTDPNNNQWCNYGACNTKPVDGNKCSPWNDNENAGTPEGWQSYCYKGGTCDGVSNHTGNYCQPGAPACKLGPVCLPTCTYVATAPCNTTCPRVPITYCNKNSKPICITQVQSTGDFQNTNNVCNVTLQPGQSCVIDVTFTPSQKGTRCGNLSVTDNTGTHTVCLSGDGY